jgi:hypothetical protein
VLLRVVFNSLTHCIVFSLSILFPGCDGHGVVPAPKANCIACWLGAFFSCVSIVLVLPRVRGIIPAGSKAVCVVMRLYSNNVKCIWGWRITDCLLKHLLLEQVTQMNLSTIIASSCLVHVLSPQRKAKLLIIVCTQIFNIVMRLVMLGRYDI